MGNYQLKGKPRLRPSGPCPECGWERCQSVATFACWIRCFRRALREHGYMRCGPHSRSLQDAGLELLKAPQPAGNEVLWAPGWAVRLLDDFRMLARKQKRRVSHQEVMRLLTPSQDHLKRPPPELVARLDELRAFAALRGWQLYRGMWYTDRS